MTEPIHILVVEDDAMIRRVYHDVLASEGYRVSLAGSGEEALSYLQLITPDIILLDLALPGVDGHEVTRRLKADRSKPFIPVIIVSAHADIATSVSSLDAGADDFLVKPVEIDELLARVRAMLRLQRSQRNLRKEQRKTELLLHLTRDLGASIDLDVLLTSFLEHLADAVGAVRASIILTRFNEADPLCYSSSRNSTITDLANVLREGVAGRVMREQTPLVIDDTVNDPRWFSRTSFHQTVRSVAAAPILRDGRSLGVITLVHFTPSYFTEEHVSLLTSVTAQSAVALESVQLFSLVQNQKELLSQRADELRRINEINALLTELMQPDQLMRLLVHAVQQQFSYPLVSLLMREGDDLVLEATAGAPANGMPPRLRLRAGQGLNGWVIEHRQIVRVDDVRDDDRFVALLPGDDETRSNLVVPVVLRREVLGTLDVRSSEVAAFSAEDEAILSAIVSQFSIAVGNARLLDEEQQRLAQLNQVNQLSVAITAQLDIQQNLQLAADAVAKLFAVGQTGLVLFGEDEQHNVLVAFHGPATPYDDDVFRLLFSSSGAQEKLTALREPKLLIDLLAKPQFALLADFLHARHIDSALIVPLLSGGRSRGVLCIDATARTTQFTRTDLELATTVASLTVQVVENARLYRAVADERSTLNAVLRGAADPIVLVGPSPENELLLANRAAEEHLHLDLRTGRGKSLQSLRNGHDNTMLNHLLPLLTNGYSSDEPVELNLPHDTSYSVSVAPVQSADEQPLGRVAVLRDITPVKRLERQERERLGSVFRRYVSPPVAERLLSAGDEFGKPTERTVGVLFADLRGFTSLTERLDPNILIERILNRYFTAMTETLYSYDGTVDKFLGDGIIGVFGTPIAHADDPQRAVMAAVDMQRALAALGEVWRSELGLEIGMGIGVSYGRAVVGNIGSEQRQDYTLIGDVVNTASRLSSLAKPGEIILSYHLHNALPPAWDAPWSIRPIGEVELKGKQEPHLIYDVCYRNR